MELQSQTKPSKRITNFIHLFIWPRFYAVKLLTIKLSYMFYVNRNHFLLLLVY